MSVVMAELKMKTWL